MAFSRMEKKTGVHAQMFLEVHKQPQTHRVRGQIRRESVEKQRKSSKKGEWRITEEKESSLLASLEAADRPRTRCDFSKSSCCEAGDGVFCLLGRELADQITTDTGKRIAIARILKQITWSPVANVVRDVLLHRRICSNYQSAFLARGRKNDCKSQNM